MRVITIALALCVLAPAAWSQTPFNLTLAADEAPGDKPWETPARIAWSSEDGDESIAVDAALKGSFAAPFGDALISVYAVAHVNDKAKKLQEAYKAGASLDYDWLIGNPIIQPGQKDPPILRLSGGLAFQRKAVYVDEPLPSCAGSPQLAFCDTQHEESLQTTFDISFLTPEVEAKEYFQGKTPDGVAIPGDQMAPFLYSIVPTLTLFHDETVSAVTNPDTGLKADGGVTGARLKIKAAVTPKWFGYRLKFEGAVQQMEAFSRSDSRQSLFDGSTSLGSISLDYSFAAAWFDKSQGWRPSIGISYMTGEDPLAGRADKEQTVVSFKLSYSPG